MSTPKKPLRFASMPELKREAARATINVTPSKIKSYESSYLKMSAQVYPRRGEKKKKEREGERLRVFEK